MDRFLDDQQANHTHVERVARLIWRLENGGEADWHRGLDTYRQRARIVLCTANGWKVA